jgi:archaellum component FlaC
MNDRELLEFIAAQVGTLTGKVDSIEKKVDSIESEVKEIKKTVINIENDHGDKLKALFDGRQQHLDQLDRIEKEVSRHEEIILRRIK